MNSNKPNLIRIKEFFKKIYRMGLCTNCGTCVGICPAEALRMIKSDSGTYRPIFFDNKCIECKLCINACPGYSFNFNELNKYLYGNIPTHYLVGNYLECFVGHSTDDFIRNTSSSGGIVSALAAFALKEGIVDGVITTKMRKDKPLEPCVFIARTREEIIAASKSKYCPVPLNTIIRKILEEKGKFAIIGLPCHIRGIRKAELLNKKLKDKIILHLGLFCSHTNTFQGTNFLLERMRISKKNVSEIFYRDEGWPGNFKIVLKNGSKRTIPFDICWDNFFSHFFIPISCTMCYDHTNEFADISFGDAWLSQFINNKKGESIFLVRNNDALRLIRKAYRSGDIKIVKIHINYVYDSQSNLMFKKRSFKSCLDLFKFFARDIPEIDFKPITPTKMAYLSSLFTYFNICLSSKKSVQKIMKYIPLMILKIYSIFIEVINNG